MKNVSDLYRLTAIQHDIAVGRQKGLGPATHLGQLQWSMRGAVDGAALERAWHKLLESKAALKTAFFLKELEKPVQVVRERVTAQIHHEKTSVTAPAEKRAWLRMCMQKLRERDFDISAAPLIHFAWIELSPEQHHFVWTYHSLILDRYSIGICFRDFCALYEAECKGAATELPVSPSYREFVGWVSRQAPEQLRATWRAQLSRESATLLDPTKPQASATQTYATRELVLSVEQGDLIQAFMRTHKLGFDTVLAALWSLALSHEREAAKVRVGLASQIRPSSLSQAKSMVGQLSAILPVEVSVEQHLPVQEWLHQLSDAVSAAASHGYGSSADIRESAGLTEQNVLFDTAVRAVDGSAEEWRNAGDSLGFVGVSVEEPRPPVAVVVDALLTPRLRIRLSYIQELIEPSTVALIAAHLQNLLCALPEAGRQSLRDWSAEQGRMYRQTRPSGVESVEATKHWPSPREVEAILRQQPMVRAASVRPSENQHNSALTADVVAEIEPARQIRFSLFYFADAMSGDSANKYRICVEGAKFADQHGFEAVWTPERHFHENGGLYPNPSVMNAALATVTKRLGLRAGSVALPLHHPLRVAEEWAMVDNLSGGRVGIAVTSGWVPNDFAFMPGTFEQKREIMLENLKKVQALWRGEAIPVKDGVNNDTELRVFPRPIQPMLPIWLTCSGRPDLFEIAGNLGHRVLTGLLTQSLEEAADKLAVYRQALEAAGHEPQKRWVTMMIHTFLGDDPTEVFNTVRGPFRNYLRSHIGLIQTMVKSLNMEIDINDPRWIDYLVDFGLERYYRTASLIGTPADCMGMVDRLIAASVDEVGCLIDFGVDTELVLAGLEHLNELRRCCEDGHYYTRHLLEVALRRWFQDDLPKINLQVSQGS